MKRTLLLGSVVMLALAGCQTSGSNNTRPKVFGSNNSTPSAGLARTPTSTSTPSNPTSASTFPSSNNTVSPTSFPAASTTGALPSTTANLGGANSGRVVTDTKLPPGVTTPDFNSTRLDNMPPSLIKGSMDPNSTTLPGNGSPFNNMPVINTPTERNVPAIGSTPGMTMPNNLPANPLAHPSNPSSGSQNTPNTTAPFQTPDPSFMR